MKITQSPDILIIDDTPWLFGIILAAAVFGVLTVVFLSLLGGDLLTHGARNPKRIPNPESFVFPVLIYARIAPSQRVAPTGALLL